MKTYKNFNIFKREPKDGEAVNPNAPTYDMTASLKNPDGSYEKSVNVGSIWLKEGQKGKYFSGQFKKNEPKYPGYVLVNEQELNDMITAYNKVVLGETVQEELPEDPSAIPF